MSDPAFLKTFTCSCGKRHDAQIDAYIIKKDAISMLGDYIRQYGCSKAFLLSDAHTHAAAGERVTAHLTAEGIPFSSYIFQEDHLEPDEHAVGSAVMHYDVTCDIVVAIGSGVINDIGKLLAKTAKTPYIIVATAPSMDGYASASSSMSMDGLKVSLPAKCANVIIGDIDVLKDAPETMLIAGLGDMLAKYISICEWRISHLITGEYYCERIAQMIRDALQKCIDHADGLLGRDENAIIAVFEGLIKGGVAMNYAGLSRPASGVEHYFSHIWDMRGLEFGTPVALHGIQCAIGTLYAARLYDRLRTLTPDREKALTYAKSFDAAAYQTDLKHFLGKGADAMIAIDEKEQKYDISKHAKRFEIIAAHWEEILAVINEEVPTAKQLAAVLDTIHAPKSAEEIGIDASLLPMTFAATKDIRDKYVLSRLCWDLGILSEMCAEFTK